MNKLVDMYNETLAEAETATEIGAVANSAVHAVSKAHFLIAKCGQQFRIYEAHHRAKGTAESAAKAEVNRELAEECERLLEEAGVWA